MLAPQAAAARAARLEARISAYSIASIRLRSLAIPLPAMSKAVPWSTDVRMMGKPRVMFTPERSSHLPVSGLILNP